VIRFARQVNASHHIALDILGLLIVDETGTARCQVFQFRYKWPDSSPPSGGSNYS